MDEKMNRALIVTGASRGIGAATARLAGQRGYSVCVNYRLNRDAADDVPEVSRAASTVSEIVDHDRGLFVRDDTPLDSLLANANLRRFGALMAVDADGRLSGVITVEQLGRALKESTQ